MRPLRIGILGSGAGTNCRAILERIRDGSLAADPRLVVSDIAEAGILRIAADFEVPHTQIACPQFRTRFDPETEERLVQTLRQRDVELVVLAGFMRVLKEPMLHGFPRRIINIHPSLLPKYPGRAAWAQALSAGEKVTGCTVHYVDAGVDTGEIVAQRQVPIMPNDTAETLHTRIQVAERELYPEVIGRLAANLTNG